MDDMLREDLSIEYELKTESHGFSLINNPEIIE